MRETLLLFLGAAEHTDPLISLSNRVTIFTKSEVQRLYNIRTSAVPKPHLVEWSDDYQQ